MMKKYFNEVWSKHFGQAENNCSPTEAPGNPNVEEQASLAFPLASMEENAEINPSGKESSDPFSMQTETGYNSRYQAKLRGKIMH